MIKHPKELHVCGFVIHLLSVEVPEHSAQYSSIYLVSQIAQKCQWDLDSHRNASFVACRIVLHNGTSHEDLICGGILVHVWSPHITFAFEGLMQATEVKMNCCGESHSAGLVQFDPRQCEVRINSVRKGSPTVAFLEPTDPSPVERFWTD